jgi:predicted HicB family RNase H-like nuclease
MNYKGYNARIEYDAKDSIFVGDVVGMSEALTFHGASVNELRGDFEFAVDHYLAACKAAGVAPERPVSGRLLLRMPPDIHSEAANRARARGVSLNEWIIEAIRNAPR